MSAKLERQRQSDMLTPDDVAEEIHPLHYAAAMGDKKSLSLWLQRKDQRVNAFTRDAFGRTALVYAVVSGKQACAEILLKSGADVNSVDNVRDAVYQSNRKDLITIISAIATCHIYIYFYTYTHKHKHIIYIHVSTTFH